VDTDMFLEVLPLKKQPARTDGIDVRCAADQRHGDTGTRQHAPEIAADGSGSHNGNAFSAHRNSSRCPKHRTCQAGWTTRAWQADFTAIEFHYRTARSFKTRSCRGIAAYHDELTMGNGQNIAAQRVVLLVRNINKLDSPAR